MNLKVEQQTENILLDRKELVVKIESSGTTPKRQDIVDKLSAALDVDKGLVIVDRILQKFGKHECKALVRIYNSTESLKKIEPPLKEKKETPKEAEPPAPKPAEVKK